MRVRVRARARVSVATSVAHDLALLVRLAGEEVSQRRVEPVHILPVVRLHLVEVRVRVRVRVGVGVGDGVGLRAGLRVRLHLRVLQAEAEHELDQGHELRTLLVRVGLGLRLGC